MRLRPSCIPCQSFILVFLPFFQTFQTTFSDKSRQMTPYGGFDDLFTRKTSAVVQPMPVHPVNDTPQKENQPLKPYAISPVLPGTSTVTHNILRMLQEPEETRKSGLPNTATRASRYTPYSTSHFMSYRQKILQDTTNTAEGINIFSSEMKKNTLRNRLL